MVIDVAQPLREVVCTLAALNAPHKQADEPSQAAGV